MSYGNGMAATAGRALDERDRRDMRAATAYRALREEFIEAARRDDVDAVMRTPLYEGPKSRPLHEVLMDGLTTQEAREVARIVFAAARGEITTELQLLANVVVATAASDYADVQADVVADQMED